MTADRKRRLDGEQENECEIKQNWFRLLFA